MTRCFAFFCACLLSLATISSAGFSAAVDDVTFTLSPPRGGGPAIRGDFRQKRSSRGENNWTTSFHPREFVGLDHAGFRAVGARPLRFALMREAGRLDCTGQGGRSRAAGRCRFTSDPTFSADLARLGVGRPDAAQSYGLMSLNARRSTVEAIVAARYPAPSVNQLIGLTALGVDAAYISGMSGAGYRLRAIDDLMQFKALGITRDWISGFARAGYSNLPADELVQMKALNITPAFVAGFERIGYGRLPVDSLVQLKALGATPEWARNLERRHGRRPTVSQLVQMKALGFER